MELFDKYNLIVIGKQRFYKENLYERDFYLECASPYSFNIGAKTIKERSWTTMILKIAIYLQTNIPKSTDELLKFKTNWSSASIYLSSKKVNSVNFIDNLFLNVNHTALHSVWLIQDILDFYKVDKSTCSLIIKRPPYIEPEEIRNYIENETILKFTEYLFSKKIDAERAPKIIHSIKYLNKFLSKMSKSYDNFFLFDDPQILSNYKSKFFKEIYKYANFTEKQISLCHKYLDYLTEFYRNYL